MKNLDCNLLQFFPSQLKQIVCLQILRCHRVSLQALCNFCPLCIDVSSCSLCETTIGCPDRISKGKAGSKPPLGNSSRSHVPDPEVPSHKAPNYHRRLTCRMGREAPSLTSTYNTLSVVCNDEQKQHDKEVSFSFFQKEMQYTWQVIPKVEVPHFLETLWHFANNPAKSPTRIPQIPHLAPLLE